jgi:hypothetical protein
MRFWAILLPLATIFAQTPPPAAAKSVIGEVTSIDAASKSIKIRADGSGASYTINLDDKTSYLRVPPGEKDLKKASKIALSDISAGDRMLARGPVSEETKSVPATTVIIMTKSDLAQKHERDRVEWQRRGVVAVVGTVNAQTKEIVVTQRARDSKSITVDASNGPGIRRYAPDSVKFSDAKPSSLAEVKPGDNIRVLGDKNEDGSRIKAEEIVFGSFQTIATTVNSVDPASGTLQLTDLQTKKPVTVRTNPDSLMRRLPPQMAQMMAMRLRGEAAGAGAPGAEGRPAGAEGQRMRPPDAAPAAEGERPRGGPGGPGGMGGRGGNPDLAQMLERMPALALTELKPGDALIISSSKGADASKITAITLVAGVEPFLAAAPRTAGVINLGAWNLDGGIPEQ